MQLVLCWAALLLLPSGFLWCFLVLSAWKYVKLFVVINLSLFAIYILLIEYWTRHDLDGWGVVIFGSVAFYGHFIITIVSTLIALFRKRILLQRI